ncbi:MgtC/SapB family protein, partial [Sandarakinorhabdus oryzae]|uniref:MgtC/SapB family protein n=1 Tax=Sandarakinorhabdus oryzae TaxID=2675220 RepID=UPI0012E29D88
RPGSRVAGLRTFGLFGLIGGLAGFVAEQAQGWLVSAVLVLAGCALVIIGYRRDKSPSATTEAAALVTLALGWIAGHGLPVPAMALAVVTAFLLSQRARLHAWIEGLSEADFHAVVLFAVIAGALWPVLPDHAMGPLNAWNPRELWLVVVVVCAISFAGYALGRTLGPGRGLLVTAAVGAIYSSTAVTAALAQRLKPEPEARPRLAAGIAIASLVMFTRVTLLVGLLVPFALFGFARVVAPGALVALVLALVLAR